MILTTDMYVPALRWRQGEYQALFRLSESAKDRIIPYIMIPEIEFDFEEWRPKKSVHEHVHPFAARYKAKWGKRPAWIDVNKTIIEKPMDDGRDIFTYVFDALRGFDAIAVPTISLGSSPTIVGSVGAIIERDSQGVAMSVQLEDLMKVDPRKKIEILASTIGVSLEETDLLIDLRAPNFEPYNTFADALISALRKLGDLSTFRNFVLIGTAIPETFKDIAKGSDQIPRHDWKFYRTVISRLPKDMRRPNFGDYTIVHPNFTAIDMRKIKSAGKIVYTTPDHWFVSKGGAFRDNPAQMHGHCEAIIKAGIFRGAAYSNGDNYIADCAVKKAKPSNQPWWKYVTINHHITHVLDDLAMFGASP